MFSYSSLCRNVICFTHSAELSQFPLTLDSLIFPGKIELMLSTFAHIDQAQVLLTAVRPEHHSLGLVLGSKNARMRKKDRS